MFLGHVHLAGQYAELSPCAGTSPLYVMSSIFSTPPSEEDVVGSVSLILWSIGALLGVKCGPAAPAPAAAGQNREHA